MYGKEELLRLYNSDLAELLRISGEICSNKIELCSLISARTGKCSQDCKYCAQSSHYRTNIETNPLLSPEEVKKAALRAKEHKSLRFAVVTSGKTPDESDFDTIIGMIKEINKIDGLNSCASIGILNEQQAKRLAEAGLKRFHHNINTCRSYHPQICTTHSYEDRINTIKLVRKYGMELCCGVIIGMGESVEQRVEMAMELAEIHPDSIPLNILMPIKDTPFGNYHDKIDEEGIMRTIAVIKIANPDSIVRFCGGRMRLSEKNQELMLKYCVEGVLTGDYLTTTGKTPEKDLETIEKLDKELICTTTLKV